MLRHFDYSLPHLNNIPMNSSPESITESITESTPPPAYFGSLTIENVKCFKGEQTIDLSDGNGKPALWTVILGNNNTGKTTLLRCLADLEPKLFHEDWFYLPKFSSSNRNITSNKNCSIIINSKVFFQIADNFFHSEEWKVQIKNTIIGNNHIQQYSSSNSETIKHLPINNLVIYGYGTSRKMDKTPLSENSNPDDNTASLFDDNIALINVEDWLIQTDYASKNGIESAKLRLDKIKNILALPDFAG